ncbi:valine--pyruvate transaminase [Anaerolineales bacterium HSG6]|nr:valine--pyruvate transaminase [Anaerolineales bacterium HSG6]MDM8532963.1 valine--pyruvate transaminase [Anaerolineales bacterium HSG25]
MQLSKFGEKFTAKTGILQLMDDLGSALNSGEEVLMLGGGNPSYIPQVQACFREKMAQLLDDGNRFERMVGDYTSPSGSRSFAEAIATLLRQKFGWQITADNIALTNGSQTAFFCLLNMFAGKFADGQNKKILLPLAPEYIGYADVGVDGDLFISYKPEFEYIDEHTFKYHVNFDDLTVTDEIGAICVSRPTNPTGNVLTDEEIQKLSDLALEHDIPFIIDNAYGTPFPNIIFTEATPVWNDHIILCMSLSKLGLPGTRTGIIIADESVIRAIGALNAIMSLAPTNVGAALTLDLVQSGEIINLSENIIQPYYQQKADQAVAWLNEALAGTPFYIHKPEGAFFLWLWFKDIPINSQELYERLKARGVVIVPGHYFFPGLDHEAWPHKQECLRMSYAQATDIVEAGIRIISEEVKRAYGMA